MKLLIIDDDLELAGLYRDQLQLDKHKVVVKNSAQNALDYLEKYDVDLVLLDVLMAEHNGLAFLYELRMHEDWLHIPVIILTNMELRDLPITPELRQLLGVRELLHKSHIKPQELSRLISEVLREPRL